MGFLKCVSVCSESGGAAGMQAQEVNCIRLQLDQKWKPAGSLSHSTQLCSYILSTGLIFIFLLLLLFSPWNVWTRFMQARLKPDPIWGGGSLRVIFTGRDWTNHANLGERDGERPRQPSMNTHRCFFLVFFTSALLCRAERCPWCPSWQSNGTGFQHHGQRQLHLPNWPLGAKKKPSFEMIESMFKTL